MSIGDLIVGLAGVSPFPILGEICLSKFFYDIFDRSRMKDLRHVGIPAILLTRFGLYRESR